MKNFLKTAICFVVKLLRHARRIFNTPRVSLSSRLASHQFLRSFVSKNVLHIVIGFIFLALSFSGVNAQFDQGCPNGYIFNAQGNCVPASSGSGNCPSGQSYNSFSDQCEANSSNSSGSTVPTGCGAAEIDPITRTCVPRTSSSGSTSSSAGGSFAPNTNTFAPNTNTFAPNTNTFGPNTNTFGPNTTRAPNQQINSVFKNPLKADSIIKLLEGLLNVVLQLAVPVVVIFFMWSGFLYIKAQGNPKALADAHTAFLYTTIGTAILFGAFALGKIVQATIETLQNIK